MPIDYERIGPTELEQVASRRVEGVGRLVRLEKRVNQSRFTHDVLREVGDLRGCGDDPKLCEVCGRASGQ